MKYNFISVKDSSWFFVQYYDLKVLNLKHHTILFLCSCQSRTRTCFIVQLYEMEWNRIWNGIIPFSFLFAFFGWCQGSWSHISLLPQLVLCRSMFSRRSVGRIPSYRWTVGLLVMTVKVNLILYSDFILTKYIVGKWFISIYVTKI